MDYYCECCDKTIKLKPKSKHLKCKAHNDFHRCDHQKITIETADINNIDEIFNSYNIEHHRKHEYFLVKCCFNINFNEYEYSPYIESELYSGKPCVFGKGF